MQSEIAHALIDGHLLEAAAYVFFAGALVNTVRNHEKRITKIEETCEKRAPLVTLFREKEGLPL